jgi:acetyltransferase-like isoleucine patch superfamily enzyme
MHNLQKLLYFARGALFSAILRLYGAKVGRRLRVEGGVRFRYKMHPGITIGDDVYIGPNSCFDVPPGMRLTLGDRASLNIGVFIGGNTAIEIGRDVLIGEYVSIRDAGHGFTDMAIPINKQPMDSKPIRIGNNIWLGRGVCVLPGATINDGCVIGANAVVNGDISLNSIAVGIPAKVIRTRGV